MDARFPTAEGYAGMFLLGHRKDGAGRTERTGTVLLKRTYDVDPATGGLTPSARALPIFTQDRPENFVLNGNFELSQADLGEGAKMASMPGAWSEEGATARLAPSQGLNATRALEVTGAAGGRVTQSIFFNEALGGRTFTLSFTARYVRAQGSTTTAAATVAGVQLEAEGSAPICVLNATLSTVATRYRLTGTWPAAVGAKQMHVVLRASSVAERVVYYDEVQVEERGYATRWDTNALARYEHDLAAFKPEGDLVVVGLTDATGTARAKVGGVTWLERQVTPGEREKALFGWQQRESPPRKDEMGAFPSSPQAYPLADPLPARFVNRFYNGYRRDALRLPALPYFRPGDEVALERGAAAVYRVRLRNERVSAAFYLYGGAGPDEERAWGWEGVPMNLDTLVFEPEADRCYAVWRGAWGFDRYAEGVYRRVVVSVTG